MKNSKLNFKYTIALVSPNDISDGKTIGHEALLHILNYIKSIDSLLIGIDEENMTEKDFSKISSGLNKIAETSGKHHDSFGTVSPLANEFYNYLDELGKKNPEMKQSIDIYISQFQKQYKKK